MLKYILLVYVALLNVPFVFGAEDSGRILDKNDFDCEELTENDQLPDDWNWMDVADRLKTKECFENIAGNGCLYFNKKSARELFEVARTHPKLSQVENFAFLQSNPSFCSP